jgi:hypothetical protein
MALLTPSPALGAGGPCTTLTSAVGDTTSTILSVANAAFLAIPGLTILIDGEQMTITAVNTSNNTITVQRGVNGTTATTHAQGAGLIPATDQRGVVRHTPTNIGAYQA